MSRPAQLLHQDHEVKIIPGPFGHHAAKLVCVVCGKWIQWLPKNYRELVNENA